MADAVASSSRDRSAQPRTSLHSLHSAHQYDPNQAVVMTDEIIRRRPSSGVYFKIVNQYGFKVKVGKGQHGEVFLAENIHQTKSVVVSPLPSPSSHPDAAGQTSLGNINPEVNEKYSATLFPYLKEKLGVPGDRGYMCVCVCPLARSTARLTPPS